MKAQSQHAAVAKLCKAYLKNKGIKCRATSDSGGNSVNVVVYDQNPEAMKLIRAELGKYKMGHFNSMEDIYEYTNRQEGPQIQYLFIENNLSPELRQRAWDYLRANAAGADAHPENIDDVNHSAQVFGEWVQTIVYRLLNGSLLGMSTKFWGVK